MQVSQVQKQFSDDWKYVPSGGDSDAKVVLFKHAPHGWDVGGGKLFLGKDGITIRKLMLNEEIPFYTMAAVPFFNPKENPKKTHAELAAPLVLKEFDTVPTKKVILFGANAARWCPVFEYPFSKFRDIENQILESNGYEFLVAPAGIQIATEPYAFMEFKHNLKHLFSPEEQEVVSDTANYIPVEARAQGLRILRHLGNRIAIDIETTGLDPWQDKILTLQISDKEGSGYAFKWDMFSVDEWAEFLAGKRFIWQNGNFDVKFLHNNGLNLWIHEDTMLMHSLLEEKPGTHSMQHMARHELSLDKYTDLVSYENIEDMSFRDLATYGARDTDITLRLANKFKPKVEGRYIHKVLHNAQNAITRAEINGILIDQPKAEQFMDEIQGHMHDIQCRLEDTYGLKNPSSPQQVAKLLYSKLGLVEQKLKGKTTTNNAALKPFIDEYPVIRDILEYRHLRKAASTYLRRILDFSSFDGRYHPEFKLAATETGRIAEKLIMLIPRADELENPDLGKQYQTRLRELFIADPGHVLIGADYSGLEVGMAAFLSRDKQLIEDFNMQRDTHSLVAISAFDLDIPEQPYETLKARVKENNDYQRTLAKMATFTWLYGGDAGAIQRQLGITVTQARKILETLRARYADLAVWQERLQSNAKVNNHATTPWGRVRHFAFHVGMSEKAEMEQLRESINFPIQAMASDMTLAAFAQVHSEGYNVLFPFHDAIYIQAPSDEAESARDRLVEIMESQLPTPVHFRVEAKIGTSWAALG